MGQQLAAFAAKPKSSHGKLPDLLASA